LILKFFIKSFSGGNPLASAGWRSRFLLSVLFFIALYEFNSHFRPAHHSRLFLLTFPQNNAIFYYVLIYVIIQVKNKALVDRKEGG